MPLPLPNHKKLHKEQPEGRPVSPVLGSHPNIQSQHTPVFSPPLPSCVFQMGEQPQRVWGV